MHKVRHIRWHIRPHHIFWAEMMLSLFFSVVIFLPTVQASGVVRFEPRGLTLQSTQPGDTTTYTLNLGYTTQTSVGSLDMQFCIDPIPYHPCVMPPGLDLSNATLSSQTGETGFSMDLVSPNHIILKRTVPTVVGNELSTYVFSNVKNPTYTDHSFSIRLTDYASTDATGPFINTGAVLAMMIQNGVALETQVPPMIIFCLGQQVTDDCSNVSGGNFTDLGNLSSAFTLSAQSQMAVGTNASNGYVIAVYGKPMAAGTHVIPAPAVPTLNAPGTNQFGINLVANSDPYVGIDPDGQSGNGVAAANYGEPDKFLFHDGDIVASAPNVSLMSRFTVSYIVNVNDNLPAGVYSTTITYVATGRF